MLLIYLHELLRGSIMKLKTITMNSQPGILLRILIISFVPGGDEKVC